MKKARLFLIFLIACLPLGATDIQDAARAGDLPRLKALVETDPALISLRDADGRTPLHHALEAGRIEAAEFLLDRGALIGDVDARSSTPLQGAANAGNATMVKMLLSRGAVLEAREMRGRTLLFLACNWGNDLETVRPLTGAGASVNDIPPDGQGFLVSTMYFGKPEIIGHPLDSGARLPDDGRALGTVIFLSASNGLERVFGPAVKAAEKVNISWWTIAAGAAPGKENIWCVERTDSGRSDPRPVSAAVNDFEHHWLFSVGSEGDLYFSLIREGGLGGKDIYKSRVVKGVHQAPENLGPVINTPGDEWMYFIGPDGSYLLIVSTGHPPAEGRFHFFISFHDEEGGWMAPIGLGEKIHAVRDGLCPSVTPDGRFMFFIGQGDIWWISAGFIDGLRPKKQVPAHKGDTH